MISSRSKLAAVRPGIYSCGAETVDLILKAALAVLIDEGAEAFTLRRIAAKSGMKVGNLSYHFPKKEVLIQLLLGEMLEFYESLLDETARRPGLTAEEQLTILIEICIDDLGSKRSTHLFTELWALSNHNPVVADRVAAFYRSAHDQIAQAVAPLNPALTPEEVDAVARFISASIEGATIFVGHGKVWAHRRNWMKAISTKALVHLAKTITANDIRRFD